MTALTRDRKVHQYNTDVLPTRHTFPVAAATNMWGGAIGCTDASGNAVPGSSSVALKVWGIVDRQAINTTPTTDGVAGSATVTLTPGVYGFNNGTGADAIGAANLGQNAYVMDDNTVGLTDGAGLRPLAGKIIAYNIQGDGLVYVQLGQASAYASVLTGQSTPVFKARGIITSLGAGACVAGVYTATANGAMATQDGLTPAVGDIFIIPAGTTNLPAAANAGPYVVTSLGSAGSKVVLTRPDWWAFGSTIQAGQLVYVAAGGTVYSNTEWKSLATAAFVVDTTDPALYPGRVSQAVTLVAGTVTIANVPFFHASKSFASAVRTVANTCTATTGGYNPTTLTVGALGTASIVIQAQVAAGSINNADISTLVVEIVNF